MMVERKREKVTIRSEDVGVVSAADLSLKTTTHVDRKGHLWKALVYGDGFLFVCSKPDGTEGPTWLAGVECEGCGADVETGLVNKTASSKSGGDLRRWVVDLAYYESDAGRCDCPQCSTHRLTLAERATREATS